MNTININNIITSREKNVKFEIVDELPLERNRKTLYIANDGRKLANTKNVMIGNKKINDIYLGSTKIWSSYTDEEQTFDLLPIVMDSDSKLHLTYTDTYPTVGNSVFIMKALSNQPINLADINIEYLGGIDGAQNKVLIQTIDNYALLFTKGSQHGNWPGGTMNAVFNEQIKLTFNNHVKTLTFKGTGDENNTSLLSGAFVNKVVKIPACGASGNQQILFYPYTFYDKYYSMNSINMYLIDYIDESNNRENFYLWNNENKIFVNGNKVKTLNNTLFNSLDVNYEYLEGNILYTIGPNTTNEFREAVVYTNQVLIHFIQEPHNDHRIYIRRDRRRALDTNYIENGSNGEYMFHLFSSKILNKSIEINADTYSSTTGTYVLYPTNLESEYDVELVGPCTLGENLYYWDNLEFKRYSCGKNSKIIFNKK